MSGTTVESTSSAGAGAAAPAPRSGRDSGGIVRAAAVALAAAGGGSAVLAAVREPGGLAGPVAAVACAAAAATVLAAGRRLRLAVTLAVLAGTHGVLAWTAAGRPLALAAWVVLGLGLPDGRLRGPRRVLAGVAVASAAAWSGWLAADGAAPDPAAIAGSAVVGVTITAAAVLAACRRAGPADRWVLQWTGAATVLAVAVAGVAAAAHALVGQPASPGPVALAGLALVPLGVAAGVSRPTARLAARALTQAMVGAGIAVFVGVVYVIVVVGLGRVPDEAERQVLGLSLAAAGVVAVLALPVRNRLLEWASRVLGEGGTSAEDVVNGFGARMTRAVPMDELLLQLAESLRTTLGPAGAEVWVGSDGVLDRTVSVPDRPPGRIRLAERELAVAGRARVVGNAWLQVWAPALLDGRADQLVRVAPIAHLGDLLGLIVVARPIDTGPYGEDDDRLLSGLARQVGLALHNVRLDSALQESLEQLRHRNAELAASRARVVAAADESRRQIERDLHDGAQQHLVAVAVKLGLVGQVLGDPETVEELVAELRTDVQAAIAELRELAHGIYPPLLRERGLAGALRAAASRSPLPVDVDVELPHRYRQEAETAVYFCCLEALQNAGKHAGAGAQVTVEVRGDGEVLRFSVVDDGIGFDAAGRGSGAGFVNMADRLGAIGGELAVRSSPGAGTTVSGTVPASPAMPPA